MHCVDCVKRDVCYYIFSFYIIKNVLFIITFYLLDRLFINFKKEAGCFLFAIDLLSIFAAE